MLFGAGLACLPSVFGLNLVTGVTCLAFRSECKRDARQGLFPQSNSGHRPGFRSDAYAQ